MSSFCERHPIHKGDEFRSRLAIAEGHSNTGECFPRRRALEEDGMGPVRILIVDDHELVRRGLRSILVTRPEWEICGEAADGSDAIEKARELKPDVVLLDITMPHMNGLDAARIIRRDLPRPK